MAHSAIQFPNLDISLAPLNFNYNSLTTTSLTLTWDPPPHDARNVSISRYMITYTCIWSRQAYCSNRETMTVLSLSSVREYPLRGLQSGRRYSMTVTACSNLWSCGMTSELHVITLASGMYVRTYSLTDVINMGTRQTLSTVLSIVEILTFKIVCRIWASIIA